MIKLLGEIGWEVMSRDIRAALDETGNEVELYIDSPGGDVMESNAISMAIAEHAMAHPGGRFTCIIGSLCASAAANILAKLPSCYTVKAHAESLVMFHSCTGWVEGGPEQLRDYSVLMQLVNEAVINALASKTTLRIEEIKAAFAGGRELWLDGKAALDCGLVNELVDAKPEQMQYTVNARTSAVLALVAKYKQNLEAKMNEEENKPTAEEETAPTVTEPVAEGEELVKEEIAEEVREELNEPAEETDWQAECDKLKAENDELKKELESLKALVAKYQPTAKPTATAAPKADWLTLLRSLNALKLPEAEYAKCYTELKAKHKPEFDAFMKAHQAR